MSTASFVVLFAIVKTTRLVPFAHLSILQRIACLFAYFIVGAAVLLVGDSIGGKKPRSAGSAVGRARAHADSAGESSGAPATPLEPAKANAIAVPFSGLSVANWIWVWVSFMSVGLVVGVAKYSFFDIDLLTSRLGTARTTWPLRPLHVTLGSIWTLLGLVQFLPEIRRRAIAVHRWIGRSYLVVSVLSVVTALAMTIYLGKRALFQDPQAGVLAGITSLLCLFMAYRAIRFHRDVREHRAWMLRAFAIMFAEVILLRAMVTWFIHVPTAVSVIGILLKYRHAAVLVVSEAINYRLLNYPLFRTGLLPVRILGVIVAVGFGMLCFYGAFEWALYAGVPGYNFSEILS